MKLVRDRIPEIIIEDGRTPVYHIATPAEFRRELFSKVTEELEEFREVPCLEEAADLLEAVYTLFEVHNFELFDIAEMGMQKSSFVGGFHRGVILEEVKDA